MSTIIIDRRLTGNRAGDRVATSYGIAAGTLKPAVLSGDVHEAADHRQLTPILSSTTWLTLRACLIPKLRVDATGDEDPDHRHC